MSVFIWLRGPKGLEPQKIVELLPPRNRFERENTPIARTRVLTDDEALLSLDDLVLRYPREEKWPEVIVSPRKEDIL